MNPYDPRTAARAKSARRRFEARLLLQRLKAKPCRDCTGTFHHCQMDFWRTQGVESPSRMLLLSLDRIEARAKECVLLCANCSRLRTWERERAARSGPT